MNTLEKYSLNIFE